MEKLIEGPWNMRYESEGELPVLVEVPPGVGIETRLVIDSLVAALETVIREDMRPSQYARMNEEDER